MGKKVAAFICVVAILLLLYSCGHNEKERTTLKDIGTYKKENTSGEFYDYIVLDYDGGACRYNRDETFFRGTFEGDGDIISEIIYIETGNKKYVMVHDGKKLYFFDDENTDVIVYEKVSDTAVYIK